MIPPLVRCCHRRSKTWARDGAPLDVATLMAGIGQDKKVRRGALTFILTRGIGQSFVADNVSAEEVFRFLEDKRTS